MRSRCAARSVFSCLVPAGYDEKVVADCGLKLTTREDVTQNMADLAERRRRARESRGKFLREIEGDDSYEHQQQFFEVAARIAKERRLSRFLFVAKRRVKGSAQQHVARRYQRDRDACAQANRDPATAVRVCDVRDRYVDRANVSFANLRMSAELGFSDTAYGLGVGMFFLGYTCSKSLDQYCGAVERPKMARPHHDHLGVWPPYSTASCAHRHSFIQFVFSLGRGSELFSWHHRLPYALVQTLGSGQGHRIVLRSCSFSCRCRFPYCDLVTGSTLARAQRMALDLRD